MVDNEFEMRGLWAYVYIISIEYSTSKSVVRCSVFYNRKTETLKMEGQIWHCGQKVAFSWLERHSNPTEEYCKEHCDESILYLFSKQHIYNITVFSIDGSTFKNIDCLSRAISPSSDRRKRRCLRKCNGVDL